MAKQQNFLEDPVGYWDKRHRTTDEWRSGGDRSVNVYRNRAFYAHRLGLLVSILDRHHLQNRLRVLDAGCGKGWLSDQLATQGHFVTGIDTSERAVELCREHRSGEFVVSSLDNFTTDLPFDAIISMDVLFHILDDNTWRGSVHNLGTLVATHGVLIISETPCEQRIPMGNYIVHRPLPAYLEILERFGVHHVETVPYQFSGNPNAFLVFKA